MDRGGVNTTNALVVRSPADKALCHGARARQSRAREPRRATAAYIRRAAPSGSGVSPRVRSFVLLSVSGSVLRWKLPHVVAEHSEDEERSSSDGGRELMESSGMMLVKSEIESCYPGPSAAAPSVVIGGAPDGVEGGHRHQVVRRRRREPPLLAPIGGGGGGIGKPLPSITVKRSSRFRGVSR